MRRGLRRAALAAGALASAAISPALAQPGAGSGHADRLLLRAVERGIAAPGANPAPLLRAHGAGAPEGGPGPADCLARFDALHYRLDLAFDLTGHTLEGTVTLVAAAVQPGLAEIALQLTDSLEVAAVRVDGAAAAFAHGGDSLLVTLPAPASPGDSLELQIDYGGTPWNEGPGGFGGFWWTLQVAFSMGVGLAAEPPSVGRAWFPCFDVPCDKATVELALTVPLGKEAVGNGELVSVVPDSLAGTVTWTWSHGYPISTYLVAASVSDYVALPDSTYPFITHYVYPHLLTRAQASFSDVDLMMDAFTALWGPYPFEEFGYVVASKGDMEHQTRVTHLAALVNGFHNYDYILAHELAHQWWGDAVTVSDWRDVWLSEGFATWHEGLYVESRYGAAAYAAYMEGLENEYFASGETSAIFDPDPMWGATSYEKGACVLHMLRHVIGDSLFFAALGDYWDAKAYGNHGTGDLQAALEAAAGQDLDWFFDEWIYAPGAPRLDWSWWSAPLPGGGYALTLAFDQTQAVGPVYRMPLDVKVLFAGGDTLVTGLLDADPDWFQFEVDQPPTDVLLDPGSWVLMRATETSPSDVPAGPAAAPAAGLRVASVTPNPAPLAAVSRIALAPRDFRPVAAEVFDGRGRLVRRLLAAGGGFLDWDGRDESGRDVPPGVYHARVRSPDGASASAKVLRAP